MIKFLIINCGSPEEIELSIPVAGKLKSHVVEAEIHFLTGKDTAYLLENTSGMDHIHTVNNNSGKVINELRKQGFDYIIDLENSALSSRIKLRLRRMDFTVRGKSFRKFIQEPFRKEVLSNQEKLERYMECLRVFSDE